MDEDSVDQDLAQDPLVDEDMDDERPQRKRHRSSRDHEPRKKRRRVEVQEEEEEEEGAFPLPVIPPDEQVLRNSTISSIKIKKKRHPEVDTSGLEEMDAWLNSMTTQELVTYHENLKIALGLCKPGENAKSALGVVELGIRHYAQNNRILGKLTANEELCSVVEQYLPDSFVQYMSGPMAIVYEIGRAIGQTNNVE